VITDPQQLARYNQLQTQYQAYDAFTDPMVQQRLNLTEPQMQQVNQFRQQWANDVQALRNLPPAQRRAAAQRFNQIQNQFNQNVNQLLVNPQERQIWNELYGQPGGFNYDAYFGDSATTGQGAAPTSGPTDPGSRSIGGPNAATSGTGSLNSGITGGTNSDVTIGTGTNGDATGAGTVGNNSTNGNSGR
jgi:hypothetical protein